MSKVRKGQQRRPYALTPNNREMLQNINATLQVKTNSLQQGQSPNTGQSSEVDKLTQNNLVLKKSTSDAQVKRGIYNKNALDEIRKTLHPFNKTGDGVANTSMESQDSFPDVNKTDSRGINEVHIRLF